MGKCFDAFDFDVVGLLSCLEVDLYHVYPRDDMNVIDCHVVLVLKFSAKVFGCLFKKIVVASSDKNCPGRYLLLRLYELKAKEFRLSVAV